MVAIWILPWIYALSNNLPFCVCQLQVQKRAVFPIYRMCQIHPALKAGLSELKNIYSLSNTCELKDFASLPQLWQQTGAAAQTCVMRVLPVPGCRRFQMLLLLSLHADLAFLSHPLLEEEKGPKASTWARPTRHFSHSALSSLSLIFIQCPGGSFLGMMFPRCSLFRFPSAAVNTHVVAKCMLVCSLWL